MKGAFMRMCSFEGCGREYVAKGYCNSHYWQYRKRKKLTPLRFRNIHNLSKIPEYAIWSAMKQRCNNQKDAAYLDYGGRGIKVCERWLDSFDNFLADMGERLTSAHSIERKDNNGNYEPGNCIWATKTQQVINRRLNKNNTSGYRGVSYHKDEQRFKAVIGFMNRTYRLGRFSTAIEAAKAYDQAAIRLHGNLAMLNFPLDRLAEAALKE